MEKLCSVDGCTKVFKARGFCSKHLQQAIKNGLPIIQPRVPKGTPCVRCKVSERLVSEKTSSSYCRKCASEIERERQRRLPAEVKKEKNKKKYNAKLRRSRRLKNFYGLTDEDFERMAANGCGICKRTDVALHVDHDHLCCPGGQDARTCGNCIRGVLCTSCNNGLGRFNDNVQFLEQAIAYLRGQ